MVTVLVPLILIIVVVVIVANNNKKKQGPPNQYYGPPGYGPPPPGYPPQGYGPQGYAPPPGMAPPPQAFAPPPQGYAPPMPPPGYQPQPQDQAVTAANGYQLALPQFTPGHRAIISIAVVAQGKVCLRAMPNGTGVFGGGLDLISGRRHPTEDVLTTVRRVLAEETGGWTGRPLATVGHAEWDLGNGQEHEICYAVLLDLPPNAPLPSAGMCTWAARGDLASLKDLGPRAPVACKFAEEALAAAGVR
ncbi:hypothetical protein DMH04_36340 [Kibdelosporangium aridum]|uniref:Nudix hydrolase domain-containing protein n=2 Tax=Kibdelosporangium aridum TaxID=2030 RepID=A0A428YZP3_KIBAR|nr:hypothetical protein DMH04_36340 [Kibdelosporangium aridum]